MLPVWALVAVGTVFVLIITAVRQKRWQRADCGKDNANEASSIDEMEGEAHRCRLDANVSHGAQSDRLATSLKLRFGEQLSREAGDGIYSRAGSKRRGTRNATNASSIQSSCGSMATAVKASPLLSSKTIGAAGDPHMALLSPTAAMFGDLLSACHQRLPITFTQLFDSMEADRFTSTARGRLSEMFRVHSYKGDSVLKLVKVNCVISSWDHLFTEIVIATKLSDLRTTKQHYTDAFLEIKSTTCVFGSYPKELYVHRRSNNQTNKRCTDEAHTESPYLAMHMSYGGVPLHRIQLNDRDPNSFRVHVLGRIFEDKSEGNGFTLDSALQLRSVLQQVALALAVAEEALQFEHRNLHAGHVLVKKMHDDTCRFRVGGRDIVVNTHGIRAHVAGYGLARMTDGNGPLYTKPSNIYGASKDHSLLFVYRRMVTITRNKWDGFYPLTNLLYVLYLAEQLHQRYRRTFRDDDRQAALVWSEVERWRDSLLRYASLGLFVEDNFKTAP